MRNVFNELEALFKMEQSIIKYANVIQKMRETITDESDLILFVNKVREKVQKEAFEAVVLNDGRGLVAMATGSGKSRVAVELAKYYEKQLKVNEEFGLIVPTEKLRDENWKEEFVKWEAESLWHQTERLCYASASKISDKNILLAILDEGHNITEMASEFFVNNHVENVVLLTATEPDGREKKEILQRLNIPVVYRLTLDVAVKLGFVAPYKITVVTTKLNDTEKDVPGGTKAKPFMTTEKAHYEYLDALANKTKNKFHIFARMQAIYNLKSKTKAMKFILEKIIPKDDRTLIFCGSIDQAETVNPYFYHSKSGDTSYNLFKQEKLNRLSCVKAINEGHNFPGIDSGVVGQLNSKEKDLIQRIGRLIRFRPGHEAHLYVLVCEGTQDVKWAQNALVNLDSTKIDYVFFEDLVKQYS